MRILLEISHPKQVHFWKNILWTLEKKGYEIEILALDKDITLYLLDVYGFKYNIIGKNKKGLIRKIVQMFRNEIYFFKVASKFKPDLFLNSILLAHLSMVINKPHIYFTDTEHAKLSHLLAFPFSDAICTPSCYKGKINRKKHISYNGYEELTYLHPNVFKVDHTVLRDINIGINEKFIILRFVAWGASHDIGHYGIEDIRKMDLISKLERYAKVFISSEKPLGKEFEKYQLKISPEKFHSLLHFSQMYIGESATMTTEAAILGIPSIYISSLKGTMGNLEELEKKYHLVYSFDDAKDAIQKAIDLLKIENLKDVWKIKKEKFITDKIDVTEYLVNMIENYPIKSK